MTGAAPQDGIRYTLQQVVDAGFLGNDWNADTLRRAIKDHGWPHVRLGRRYGLTKAHIDAILAAGDHSGGAEAGLSRPARRGRRPVAPASLPAGAARLVARPGAARRRAS